MTVSVIVPTLDGSVRVRFPDDPRLEVITVRGVSPVGKARNEGLRRATGDYIAWVDADDEITDDWWTEISTALERDEPDVLTFDAEYVGWPHHGDSVWGVGLQDVTPARLLRDVCRDGCRPSTLFIYVIRRELWQGLKFDESVKVLEDYLLVPRVIALAKNCAYVPRKLYRYICNVDSILHKCVVEKEDDITRFWASRLEAVPQDCKGAAAWGSAVNCYWICDRVALRPQSIENENVRMNAGRCRKFVRRHFPLLVREAFFAAELPLRERLEWLVRFFCVVSGFWWLQRRRHRA